MCSSRYAYGAFDITVQNIPCRKSFQHQAASIQSYGGARQQKAKDTDLSSNFCFANELLSFHPGFLLAQLPLGCMRLPLQSQHLCMQLVEAGCEAADLVD